MKADYRNISHDGTYEATSVSFRVATMPEPEVSITGIQSTEGTLVLQWQGNRTDLLYMVESCTSLPTAGWSSAVPTSQWWISGTSWTNTGPARSREFFRIKAKEQ